ncbi:protein DETOXIFICATION 43 [Andrographis paniculata]|uniref:protein DETOXIFICATION 43 n=1 Tax=Andrographis paniculata TaxID=175694 RepID=UPI0021E94BBC|nr:protein DETOXIFICATION 43 [Andrographis paniculata]XP_051151835.1 protein DETOXIFICATION 43 [Andrographis paniculata]XP_051151883.1 protein DETOXIFICATION 43 [Andrographis paniculata]
MNMAADDHSSNPPKKWIDLPIFIFFHDPTSVFKRDKLGREILGIALPAAMALAADPIASLIDTAFIGQLGSVQIAAVGVAIAIFNQASKVTIFPLVSITTSFVAEEDTVKRINDRKLQNDVEMGSAVDDKSFDHDAGDEEKDQQIVASENTQCKNPADDDGNGVDKDAPATVSKETEKTERRNIPSASTALALGGVLGLLQTILLIFLAKPFLGFMGVKEGSPMLPPAQKYLTIRALGAPAVLLSLAMQGVFRGFKDTKTPLLATVVGDVMNIILDPIFIFACRLGVTGAAMAHVLSQYLISLILLVKLMKQVNLMPPSAKDLQFSRFLKNGFLLLARVIAATICVTLAASMAARLGATPMAAFQICLQVWLTSSLLADGLAVAGQAILACAFAEKDFKKATAAAVRVLQMSFVLGLGLALLVGLGLNFGSGIFTKDKNVIRMIAIGIPFVAATQPINSLAFVFDGVNFGASDFAYSAYSMVLVSIVSIGCLFIMAKTNGFVGIWLALTVYMFLRTFAGFWRMGMGTGPWQFLKRRSLPPAVI